MTIVARIGVDPARPERLTMFHVSPVDWIDGTVGNRFARDDTRESIAALLARHGLTLNADNTVSNKES